MPRKSLTVTVGTPGYQAVCPVPREGIGVFEAMSLTVRGWIDAVRNRDVADTAHTHSLHRLLAAHRRRETEAVRRIDGALSVVDRALAPLEAVLATPLPQPVDVPGAAELDRLADADRAARAARVRAAQAARVQAEAAGAQHAAAARTAAELRSIRTAIAVEGDDVRRQWAEAYAMRAARYTRVRFGRRGRRPESEPAVAPYLPADDPTVLRR